MSKSARRGSDPIETARSTRDHSRKTRHKKRTCGNLPLAPANPTGIFDAVDRSRHERLRLLARCDEVTQNEAGAQIKVDRYNLEVEVSLDTGSTWQVHSRHRVSGKRDDDANTYVQFVVRPIRKRPKVRYRLRWQAVQAGTGCKSAWSTWTSALDPTDSVDPPPPTDVQVLGRIDRIVVRCKLPTDPDDAEAVHEDVAFSRAGLSLSPQFSSDYDIEPYVHGNRVSFPIPRADRSKTFYAWWRTVDESRNKSPKIPAWDPDLHGGIGNSSPGAPPDGVRVRGADRQRARWTVPGNAVVGTYKQMWTADLDYVAVKARATAGDHDPATHPNDGCPQGSALKLNLVLISKDLGTRQHLFSTDDLLKIDAGTHKDVNFVQDFRITEIPEDWHVALRVAAVGSTKPGNDIVVTLILEAA